VVISQTAIGYFKSQVTQFEGCSQRKKRRREESCFVVVVASAEREAGNLGV
jgi:hypothetical protein